MAAITTSSSTAGWVPTDVVFGRGSTASTATNNLNTDVNTKHQTQGFQLRVFHVTGVDDGETVTVEYPVIAVAWQPEDASDDIVSPWVAAAATATGSRARSSSTITFETAASAAAGWIWCLCRS